MFVLNYENEKNAPDTLHNVAAEWKKVRAKQKAAFEMLDVILNVK